MTDILERLRGYNPPDRTIDDQRQLAIDLKDAADEIESLRKQFLGGVTAILAKVQENSTIVKDAEARLDRAGL